MIKYTECKQQQVLFANEHLLKKKLLNVSDGFRNSSITFVSYRISITQRSTSIPWNVGECTWSHMDGIKIDSGETVKKIHLFCLRLFIFFLNEILKINTNSIYVH